MTAVEPRPIAGWKGESRLPDSLAAWLERNPLASLVLNAVRAVDERWLQPVASKGAGMAFQPRALLAMVTYCYVLEIYGSQDIEDLMRRDGLFRFLCANEFPDWHAVRRFRRNNRETIQRCLAEALRHIWKSGSFERYTGCPCTDHGKEARVPEWRKALDPAHLMDEANERIERAMFIDHMAIDE